jgi:hypothetical protein
LGLTVYKDALCTDDGAVDAVYFRSVAKNSLCFITLTINCDRAARRRATAGLAIGAGFISRTTAFTAIAGGSAFASGFGIVVDRFDRTSDGY